MRIGLFIAALAIRIIAIEATGAGTMTFGDAGDYVDTARAVCTDQVYPERGNLPFFRPPGLPFFIAGATLCEPGRVRAIKYALAACDAATVVVIFEVALLLFVMRAPSSAFGTFSPWRGRRASIGEPSPPRAGEKVPKADEGAKGAVLAGLAAALYPFFIFSTTDVRSEPLFMLLLTLAILLLLRENYAGAGVATALAALTRPTALICLVLFALFARKKAPPLLIAAVLTLAPWMARNYLRFGELIVVNDAASYSIWHASHPETRRIYAATDREELRRRELEFETKTIHAVAAQVASRATSPMTRDAEWRRMAIDDLRREPAASAAFAARKAWLYWRPWLNPIEHGPKAVAGSAGILITLYVLAAIGLWRHRDRKLVLAVVLYFAALWLAHIPHQVVMRYRIPLTDPLLIVFAAGAIASLRTRHADADSRDRSAAT